jgi:hypothetical protein
MEVTKLYETTHNNLGRDILHFYCLNEFFSSFLLLLLLLLIVWEKMGKWHIWLPKLMK